jgi:hypothetical protein
MGKMRESPAVKLKCVSKLAGAILVPFVAAAAAAGAGGITLVSTSWLLLLQTVGTTHKANLLATAG